MTADPLRRVSISLRQAMYLPWSAALPEMWVEAARSAIMADKVSRFTHAPVRVRVAPWKDIVILSSDPVYRPPEPVLLSRFSPDGALKGSVRIEPPDHNCDRWQIDDFLVDESGTVYLLETASYPTGSSNYLRSLAPTGGMNWMRSGPTAVNGFDPARFKGTFQRLLVDARSTPYLSFTKHRGQVARINVADGTLEPYADWGEWTGDAFMDGGGRLYFVRYLSESRQRGWACFDPCIRQETMQPGDDSLYGLYDIPIGVDERGRVYTVMGTRIACIDGRANLLWQERIENVIVDADTGSVYTSECRISGNTTQVQVREWTGGGVPKGERTLGIPGNLITEHQAGWKVIRLDEERRYCVYGGETVYRDGALLVYSPEGVLETVTVPAPALHTAEYRLQGGRTWCVDLQGSVYLPVTGPAGFHLIRLNVNE